MINEHLSPSIYESWNDVYLNNNVWELPWVSKEIHPELKKVIESLPIKSGNALDVGCGLGQVSRYLAQIGFEVTAIDISEEAIRLSRELNDTGKQIDYRVSNSINFQSEAKYDLIVDFLHIHDIERVNISSYLNNLENLLSINGFIIISTFSQNDESNISNNSRKSNYVKQEINYYSEEEVINFFSNDYIIVNNKSLIVGKRNENYKSYLLILKKS